MSALRTLFKWLHHGKRRPTSRRNISTLHVIDILS
jgi:hypothetical protein